MKHSALLLGLTAIATTSVFATSAQATTLVTSLPIQFVTTSGGFLPGAGAPNPVTGISASITGSGSGDTLPFNPSTGGAILSNFVAANVTGTYNYNGTDAADFLRFDLIAGDSTDPNDGTFSSVFGSFLGSGATTGSGAFDFDLSAFVPPNANKFLAIHFRQFSQLGTTTSSHGATKLLITTKVPHPIPEPSNMAGLGLLGIGLAASLTRKKLQAKTKVAA